MYLLAGWGLLCCVRDFSSCGERGLLFVVVHGLLIVVASLVSEHRLSARGLSRCGLRALERRLSSCGAQAQLLRGMWDLPRPGLEPVSPALAGGFLTTAPPGKSQKWDFLIFIFCIVSFSQFKSSLKKIKKKKKNNNVFNHTVVCQVLKSIWLQNCVRKLLCKSASSICQGLINQIYQQVVQGW